MDQRVEAQVNLRGVKELAQRLEKSSGDLSKRSEMDPEKKRALREKLVHLETPKGGKNG